MKPSAGDVLRAILLAGVLVVPALAADFSQNDPERAEIGSFGGESKDPRWKSGHR